MNKYETVFIINPNVEEAGVKELIEKFSNIINNDGKVEEVQEMGKRKLAYEIKKNSEGYYVVINFEANPELTGRCGVMVGGEGPLLCGPWSGAKEGGAGQSLLGQCSRSVKP